MTTFDAIARLADDPATEVLLLVAEPLRNAGFIMNAAAALGLNSRAQEIGVSLQPVVNEEWFDRFDDAV